MSGWATALCVGALLLFSGESMRAAAEAAALFCSAVLPALFPLSVLAALPKRERSGKTGRGAVWAVLFGWAAGSPASARRVAEDWRSGRLGGRWLEPTLVAANVMSPMFFVGTLASWTGSAQAGWRMLAVHLAAAALAGGLCAALSPAAAVKGQGRSPCQGAGGKPLPAGGLRAAARKRFERQRRPQPLAARHADSPPLAGEQAARPLSPDISAHSPAPPPTPAASPLPAAIASAAQGMLAVCGAMMLFSVLGAALQAVLARFAPAWTADNAPALAALHALLEIGGGARRVTLAYDAPVALLCALCGFGGLSLWTQTLAFAGACARPARLLCWRAVHGALSYAICLLWESVSPLATGAVASLAAARPTISGCPPAILPLLLLALLPAFWQRSRTCWPRS